MATRAAAASNLTRTQQLLWAGQQLSPATPLYNMAFAFRIEGAVDPELFRAAFGRLVAECEALRTVFEAGEGAARRRVLRELPYELPVEDFSGRADPEREATEWMQARCEEMFALDRRLFDAALVRLAPDLWVWYLNEHHLVCDAWSVALLLRRLDEIYASLQAGEESAPGRLGSFESYVALERETREQAEPAEHWELAAQASPTAPRLYGEDGRQASTASDRLTFPLGEERTRRLLELAAQPGFRSFSQDLGFFQILATTIFAWLERVSGQRELAIAAPSHNRALPELRDTVGLLTEVFPLPAEVAEGDTFRQLHEKVRVATSSFLRHAAPGAADARYTRACNVILNFVRGSFGSFAGHPVHTDWLHPGHHDREHVVRLQVHDFEGKDRWRIQFDLNRDAFGPGRSERAVAHFAELLDAFLDDPDGEIAAPELMTAEERRELVAFNATSAVPATETVVQTFERVVATSPDAVAIRCGEDSLTYGELDGRASAIASLLRAQGAGAGGNVGILRKRSPGTIAAILGALKAGAAYVPLDPAWPASRIAWVAENAEISLFLTEPDFEGELPVGARAMVPETAGRGDPAAGAAQAGGGEASQGAPGPGLGERAYVLYTSGSTGKPKGVVIEHAAFAHYVGWARNKYAGSDGLSFPLFSPLTFDLTVTSIFVPLTSGGTIVVYPETGDRADLALLDVADDNLVDIIKLTPSHLRLLEDRDLRESRVRQLVLGGESLTAEAVARIVRTFGGDVTVHNEYGPTEATVGCVVHSFRAGDAPPATAPIGRPIDNMRAWVVDSRGRPVPDGVIGELVLGGAGLAAGYLNQPERTAESFVASELDAEGRVYRTGDLARRNRAGLLEYCDRVDHQLKIRGARVEPGEIEAALSEHPGVESCVVSAFRRAPAPAQGPVKYCVRCGLASDYPEARYDEHGVCHLCQAFEGYKDRAQDYFRNLAEFEAIFRPGREEREIDCLALLSGGKDSTYLLCRLVDLGLRVVSFTLDNGYISDGAKENIRRVTDQLGVEHIFGTTPAMNEIFVDSLKRYSNVCQGCFKTIYTLALKTARDRNIPFIVTGLSRGQFFETRLTEELWTDPELDPSQIDSIVLQARKAYHRVDDAPRRLLDTSVFEGDRIFDEVRFVDFYRYCDVDLDDLYAYLEKRVPWVRPSDTGRSTNCLINDTGIFVHKREQGYHNYALPYSWDVRLGHKKRDAALEELDDEIDVDDVHRILGEIGYRLPEPADELRLVAYYEAAAELPAAALTDHLAARLPAFLVPSHFVRLDRIPVTPNGKVDRAALPDPGSVERRTDEEYVAPRSPGEETLARLWADALRVERVGIHDDFFQLGGDSILAIQIVARAHGAGLHLSPADLFEALTVEELAKRCGDGAGTGEVERSEGPVRLAPAQAWMLEGEEAGESHWNHVVRVELAQGIPEAALRESLAALCDRHDALRLAFRREADTWRAACEDTGAAPELRLTEDLDAARRELDRPFVLGRAPLFRVAARPAGDEIREILFVAHHLIVDAVSWSLLLEDFAGLTRDLAAGRIPGPPAPTASLARWGEAAVDEATSGATAGELSYWRDVLAAPAAVLPLGVAPAGAADLVGGEQKVTARLDGEVTRALLEEVPASGRIRVQEVILTALSRTLAAWTGGRHVRFWLEGHGREAIREGVDATRTVGWFTSLFPVSLELPAQDDPGAILREVKDQLRAVPRRGVGYGLLRYASASDEVRHGLAQRERKDLSFNYLGDVDRLLAAGDVFRPAAPLELSRAPETRRRFALEVTAMVRGGELEVEWAFPADRLATDEARRQAERFVQELRATVEHCRAHPEGEASATDFPLAGLDASKLDKLAAALRRADAGPGSPGD